MTTMLASGRAQAAARRTTLVALAGRELRRFAVNPVFLFGVVGLTAWLTSTSPGASVTEIDSVNALPAGFLGGIGMMAAFSLTRSMRDSEPVVGVTPTALPARSAALCTVAIVPLICGVLTLFAFLHFYPLGSPVYGPFSPSARIAILAGQIVVPSLGGPLLGVALGRWVRFPGAAFVLFMVLYGWLNLVTFLSLSHPGSAAFTAVRLFSPFAFFTLHENGAGVTAWRGSPWFFLGWQIALCAIAVLAALLRGAEGRARSRITATLSIAVATAGIMLVLAATSGFPHAVTA